MAFGYQLAVFIVGGAAAYWAVGVMGSRLRDAFELRHIKVFILRGGFVAVVVSIILGSPTLQGL